MAKRFAIRSLDEVNTYLAHPVLGARLNEWTEAVFLVDGVGADLAKMFGELDTMKFAPCMSLFARADEEGIIFEVGMVRHGLKNIIGGGNDGK